VVEEVNKREQKYAEVDLGFDEKIKVYRLRVKDVRAIFEKILELGSGEDEAEEGKPLLEVFEGFRRDFLPFCTSLTDEQFEELDGKEISQLWTTFKDENAFFFDAWRKSGLDQVLKMGVMNLKGLMNETTSSPLSTGEP
jgi:hypothetical protein